MIETMRSYPDYRPSGDEWLGKVPSHWRFTSLGAISARKSVRNRPDLPLLSVLREKGVVLRSSLSQDQNHNFIPDDLTNYQVANEGDLVVNKMKAWQGSVGIAPQDGIVSPAYYIFELAEIKKKYAHWLLRSRLYADFFGRASDGVRIGQWDLGIPAMKRIPVVIPPPKEQDVIALFLDEMDRRFARFIRNRRRLIEVLNEQKQAIINQAVTRGLDPNASLKPSGMDWLGDIPEHWEVVALRYLATRFGSGVTPRGGATVYQDTGVPFLRSQNIHFDGLRLEGVARIAPALHASLSATHVRPGDVLLNITGASIGRVCAVPPHFAEGNVNQHVCMIRPRRDRISSAFLAGYLSTGFMQREIYIDQNGASREGLGLAAIRAFKIALPPVEEQQAITNQVEAVTASLVTRIQKTQREIDLIHEYRTRLIADVVTGKVDVRHLAPTPGSEDLKVMVEELEPLYEAAEANWTKKP